MTGIYWEGWIGMNKSKKLLPTMGKMHKLPAVAYDILPGPLAVIVHEPYKNKANQIGLINGQTT